ncbi:MAG: hypothetical protein AUH08_08970 [Verrucomicrobia bacterium 13_2_20CM_54_12]|nr:MAG: hypothetical protein AUH08_08970 [Verrucomicrobia bacterium 13_2_20CM_54_12]
MLTFEERVSYQRAIEDVYWRHRIWPKERPDPKPSLDAVMSQAQFEKKVADYLRKSQALEDYWQRPITTDQLQAEMDRMAQHTKQPEVLQELCEALGNNPFVIAECLARPALAEHLITNWYASDQRIHGELRQRAETELQAHPSIGQMKQLSGKYNEIELARNDSAQAKQNRDSGRSIKLNVREWDETVQKLAQRFSARAVAAGVSPAKDTQIKTRVVSPLQEDESRYYIIAVIKKTNDRLKVATVSWQKEPVQSWLTRAETPFSTATAALSGNYTLPKIQGSGCIEDTWTATAGPPEGREFHTAVWTGSEMIVWGGQTGSFIDFNTGGRYNPSTDSWTATNVANAPDARTSHTAVWTGNEMIVWGGLDENFVELNTGGRYNPGTDSWVATSTTDAPNGRNAHTAVWTGSEMIIWGGWDGGTFFNTGGRYDPTTDSWTATSTSNAPEGRTNHTAVLTDNEMIIWAGTGEFNALNTGGRYDPVTNSWTTTSTTNAPDARFSHTAVSTGGEMIVWGGAGQPFANFNTGGRYNPRTDSWTATSTTNVPNGRAYHTAVWTGSKMVVWGGFDFASGDFNTGGIYDPNTDTWVATTTTNAPSPRESHTAVWTGNEMIIWGGSGDFGSADFNTGGRYDPTADSWVASDLGNVPSARVYHTAVWSGSEMVVWGGLEDVFALNSGARYNPSTDSWTSTSTTNVPIARWGHTAIWTGNQMIVWGGVDDNLNFLNTGGRYDASADNWVGTSTTNAPIGRSVHTAVYSGAEMIVWGGSDENGFPLNTGGRDNQPARRLGERFTLQCGLAAK